ncbi:MAG: ComEC/Rec2 family competence protein [Bacteroidales bacterium]|nr:ComEC/Rec2 family competence protein [Bacteroidales bacterium]
MKDGLDIVTASLPYVAGVAAAAAVGAGPTLGGVLLAAAAGCIAAICVSKKRNTLLVALLFLLLGMFSWSAGGNSPFGSSPFGLTPPPLRGGPPEAKEPGVPENLSIFGVSSRVARPSGGVPPAVLPRIPFPHQRTNALLRALLTGKRDMLDRATASAFRKAGASHILALSGLHLGIIYLIISRLLFFLGKSRRASILRSAIIVGLCGAYMAATGAGPSIVRAFIFITLAEIARNCPGRRRSGVNIWCTALLIQLCVKPSVISSIGFQMSYLAMLGTFTLFPILRDWYPSAGPKKDRFLPVKRIWEMMALSISCQVFTAPLVWLRFHTFPKYFLLANLISLPLTEALIVGGLACTGLEAIKISPRFLTRAVDWISELLCSSLETIASIP